MSLIGWLLRLDFCFRLQINSTGMLVLRCTILLSAESCLDGSSEGGGTNINVTQSLLHPQSMTRTSRRDHSVALVGIQIERGLEQSSFVFRWNHHEAVLVGVDQLIGNHFPPEHLDFAMPTNRMRKSVAHTEPGVREP